MTTITAKVIADNECGEYRLTSMQLTYPRIIHAELYTHRAFSKPETDEDYSRNSASSRAIPVRRMIEAVRKDPFIPLVWGKNVAGMQAKEELTGSALILAKEIWQRACDNVCREAERLAELEIRDKKIVGAHKQIVNRLLEPFSHITVLVSSTTWDNFFKLRIHPDAEPHIKMLAEAMKAALDASVPNKIENPSGSEDNPFLYLLNCHTPYVNNSEKYKITHHYINGEEPNKIIRKALNLSVARCASTSYNTVEGTQMTLEKSEEIVAKLLGSDVLHASPFEHVAFPDSEGLQKNLWGNFQGFVQYRKVIEKNGG